MSGDIYNTPASNLENNIDSDADFKLESNLKFKKTMIMNIIGGVCFLIMGIALYLNKTNSEQSMSLLFITSAYSVLCGSAFGSAYALSAQAGSKLQLVMISINWLFIGIFILSAVVIIISAWSSLDAIGSKIFPLIPAVFMFVIPQLININALKQLRINPQKA